MKYNCFRRYTSVMLVTVILCTACSRSGEERQGASSTVGDSFSEDMEAGTEECTKTKGDVFIIEDDFAVMAEMPESWRYVHRNVMDYFDYKKYFQSNFAYEFDTYENQHRVTFLGKNQSKEDCQDNFFEISVRKHVWQEDESLFSDVEEAAVSFFFADGTQGEWKNIVYETEGQDSVTNQMEYYGLLYDSAKTGSVVLEMPLSEYEANETEILSFLESISFCTSKLGENKEEDIFNRELLTVHIWNEYMKLNLQLPEGVIFEDENTYTEEDTKSFSFFFYLDEEKKNYIELYYDRGEFVLSNAMLFRYYPNTTDFKDVVYEIPDHYYDNAGYYWPKHRLAVWVYLEDKGDKKMQEYIKTIVQSVEFE